jgi:hypothetical protein
MRIFVSSSFEDLREHRAAAIHVLGQLGHEVLAMEDMVAGSAAPLAKVLEMVDRSEAYVGIFAWRYGYVPKSAELQPLTPVKIPTVEGAVPGETSITEYEYRRAVQRKLPIMAFLLDEHYPWPPQFIDGFDKTRAEAPLNAEKIRALRQRLQQERIVGWFTTPSHLETRVSAAVTMAGLTSQLDLQPATALDPIIGTPGDTSAEFGIKQAIIAAGDHQHALKIDLATTWWSTRLYLIAALAQRLTQVRRFVLLDTRPTSASAPAGALSSPTASQVEEHFVGQISTNAIVSTVGPKVSYLEAFEKQLQVRSLDYNDVGTEIDDLLVCWRTAFADQLGVHANERSAKVDLTVELLRRWFGDMMFQQPLHIADLQRASVVDLLRLLDYPNDFVPVLTRHDPVAEGPTAAERVDVLDKTLLNARLARSYLVELLDRARIS